MSKVQDLIAVVRGINKVLGASVQVQEAYIKHIWANSSIKDIIEQNISQTSQCGKQIMSNPGEELKKISGAIQETLDRSSVVVEGLKHYSSMGAAQKSSTTSETVNVNVSKSSSGGADLKNLDIAQITLKELENLLSERNKNRTVSLRIDPKIDPTKTVKPEIKSSQVEPNLDPVELQIQKPLVAETSSQPESSPSAAGVEKTKRANETSFLKDEKSVKSVMDFISSYKEPIESSSEKPVSIQLPEVSIEFYCKSNMK